jgi:hypothetical protein
VCLSDVAALGQSSSFITCDSYIGLGAQGTDIINRKVTFDLADEMGSDLPDKTALPPFVAFVVKQNHLESRMAALEFLEDHVFDFGPGLLWLAHAQLPQALLTPSTQ